MFSRGKAHIQMLPAVILCTVHVRASCREATHGAHRLFCFSGHPSLLGPGGFLHGCRSAEVASCWTWMGWVTCAPHWHRIPGGGIPQATTMEKEPLARRKKGSNFLFSKLMKNRRPEISVQRGYLSAGQTFHLWGLSERSLEEVLLERAPPPRTLLSFLSLCCYIINHTTKEKISYSH